MGGEGTQNSCLCTQVLDDWQYHSYSTYILNAHMYQHVVLLPLELNNLTQQLISNQVPVADLGGFQRFPLKAPLANNIIEIH